jgi:hypothetical protein
LFGRKQRDQPLCSGSRWLLSVGLVLIGSACGSDGGETAAGREWQSMGVPYVTAIHVSADRRMLTIDVKVPTAADPHRCTRNLGSSIIDFSAQSTLVQVGAEISNDPACKGERAASVEVVLPSPLGNRIVGVNSSWMFQPDPANPTTMRQCGDDGCRSTPAACSGNDSIERAARGTDIQQPVTLSVVSCNAKWLVMDLHFRGGASSIASTGMHWFYRASPQGWTAITGTRDGGCAAVQRAEPEFPSARCADLPPIS